MSSDELVQIRDQVNFTFDDKDKALELLYPAQAVENDHSLFVACLVFRKLMTQRAQAQSLYEEIVLEEDRNPRKLVDLCLKNEFPALQLEAIWCCTNISSGRGHLCTELVEVGILHSLRKLFENP